MEEGFVRPPNPLTNASRVSRLLFLWPYALLKIGIKRPLTDADLADVPEIDTSARNRVEFEKLWTAERQRCPSKPSLKRALFLDYLKKLALVQPLIGIAGIAKIAQAISLGRLVDSLEEGGKGGFLWAGIIVGCGVTILFEHHHVFLATWRYGMRIRVSCIAAIYSKSLRLSSTNHSAATSHGRIMNLASNDVERFLTASLFLSYLWWSLIEACVIFAVGVWLVGPAFAAGMGILFVFLLPLQFYLSRRFVHFRGKIAAITDQRVNFVSQAVRGARVMKMSGYEYRFLDRIKEFRAKEVAQIRKANRLKAYNESLFYSTNVVVSVVVFLVHIGMGETLQAGDVFTVFTLINILQLNVVKHGGMAVMGASECMVSIDRIQEYLEFPELRPTLAMTNEPKVEKAARAPEAEVNKGSSDSRTNQDVAMKLHNVTCYWNSSGDSLPMSTTDSESDGTPEELLTALEDVSIDFNFGQLTAVIGTVGSGKSALLLALVQELPVAKGLYERNAALSIAYAAQDPWIMDGSVKENILMGSGYNEEWYLTVVSACGLIPDFEKLRDGDSTIVGDRGVQCSGGQRARIGLARAMYRDADIIVADDPLSAVDAKVGRQLFEEAILDLAVNRGKCVVLATHQHQYISDHRCILVASSKVTCIGTYAECVEASQGKLTAHAESDAIDNLVAEVDDSKENSNEGKTAKSIKSSGVGDHDNEEVIRQGLVQRSTYLKYTSAMGGWSVAFCLLLLYSVTQGSVIATITSLGRWAERPGEEQEDTGFMLLVSGLSLLVMVLALSRAFVMFHFAVKASQNLHDQMARAVLRAKIEFFDTNPLGRVLNRFSADVGSSDDLLPATLFDFFVIAFMILGAFATTVATLPFTLLAFPPLLFYFFWARKVYVSSSRELKRLEGFARSPIFAKLSESLGGIASIRANGAQKAFQTKFETVHDSHTRAFFAFMGSARWVGFHLDSIVVFFLSVVCFLSVLFQTQGWFDVDAAILGLALSMLLQLAGLFQWCIRQSAEVVNHMVSVERVIEFGSLPSEAPLEMDEDEVVRKDEWPANGAIEFADLSVRYRESLPLALEGISCKIPAGARVGVVGRTGSGKSTVVQTLFRLLEAENGKIMIDDVDISTIGLHMLRTKISVIPQVPTLFSGCSIRENLDLFGLHSDESIQKVLSDCHLGEVIDDLPAGINSLVAEGGSNFSVGQRQLLCLARAILSKNRILVLDEATASVDRRTDQLLHDALHHSFSDGTILSVAHRLDTIIEHDFILVLGQGKVLEFGPPAELIRSKGAFASMVRDTGGNMSRELQQRAFDKEEREKAN